MYLFTSNNCTTCVRCAKCIRREINRILTPWALFLTLALVSNVGEVIKLIHFQSKIGMDHAIFIAAHFILFVIGVITHLCVYYVLSQFRNKQLDIDYVPRCNKTIFWLKRAFGVGIAVSSLTVFFYWNNLLAHPLTSLPMIFGFIVEYTMTVILSVEVLNIMCQYIIALRTPTETGDSKKCDDWRSCNSCTTQYKKNMKISMGIYFGLELVALFFGFNTMPMYCDIQFNSDNMSLFLAHQVLIGCIICDSVRKSYPRVDRFVTGLSWLGYLEFGRVFLTTFPTHLNIILYGIIAAVSHYCFVKLTEENRIIIGKESEDRCDAVIHVPRPVCGTQ